MYYKFILFFLFFIPSFGLLAQMPITHIYVFDFEQTDKGFRLESPMFLSGDNVKGYNNQPRFSGNALWATVQGENDKNTDIYTFNVLRKEKSRITHTPEAEYSPTPMLDGLHFSVIRVDTEGGAQRLWKYPLSQSHRGSSLFVNLKNVGYHAWLSKDKVALFTLETDTLHSLRIGDVRTQRTTKVLDHIGRCFQTDDKGLLYFTQKKAGKHLLKKLDPDKLQIYLIIQMPEGSQDYILMKDGTIVCGKGSELYKFTPGKDSDWKIFADLKGWGISNITRLAIGEKKLALVNKVK